MQTIHHQLLPQMPRSTGYPPSNHRGEIPSQPRLVMCMFERQQGCHQELMVQRLDFLVTSIVQVGVKVVKLREKSKQLGFQLIEQSIQCPVFPLLLAMVEKDWDNR